MCRSVLQRDVVDGAQDLPGRLVHVQHVFLVLGGLLGGAAGGTLATQENWIWSIPVGIVGGAMVGCQVDGG